jgi:hypothetical protein
LSFPQPEKRCSLDLIFAPEGEKAGIEWCLSGKILPAPAGPGCASARENGADRPVFL